MATKSKANDAADDADDDKETPLEPIGPNVDDDSESSDIIADKHTMEGTDDDEDADEDKGKKKAAPKDDDAGHSENKADDDEDEDEEEDKKDGPKKKSRKQRQREARDRSNRELAYLRIRVDQLEQTSGVHEARALQGEAAALDQRITALQNQLALADEVVAEATTQGVKKDLLEGQKLQRDISEKLNRLKSARGQLQEQVEQATEEVERAPAPGAKLDPAITAFAKTWMEDNDWYNPKDKNSKETQRIARIDAQILREGFDPREEDYWTELTKRVKKAYPDRFSDNDDDDEDEDQDEDEDAPHRSSNKPNGKAGAAKDNGGKRKGGGPTFTTRGREVTLKANQVAISPARKAAMIEAGVWDDPEERQRYLKQYAKYDRDHTSRA